jgi:6-pyruvoyltetrahydropterin/6-carboxytetrahydropterin synthase
MQAEVVKTFRFEAAHSLPCAPEGHKCRRLHGHGYRVDIHVAGAVNARTGWVIDFADIARAVEPVLSGLDHRNLNELEGLANPTAEMLARYIWDRVAPLLAGLSVVTVWESDSSRCVYRGGGD